MADDLPRTVATAAGYEARTRDDEPRVRVGACETAVDARRNTSFGRALWRSRDAATHSPVHPAWQRLSRRTRSTRSRRGWIPSGCGATSQWRHTRHSRSEGQRTCCTMPRPLTLWQMRVTAARAVGVPFFLLGLGANILVGDRGVRGLVIRNTAGQFTFLTTDACGSRAAQSWRHSSVRPSRVGWSGLEHYVGIPSTVGGAIWQNLHFLSPAPARERTMFIEEVFHSCVLLTESGSQMIADRRRAWRSATTRSILHHRPDIVLSVVFQLDRGDPVAMHRVMHENLSWRGSPASVARVLSECRLDLQEDRRSRRGTIDRASGTQGIPSWRRADLADPCEHHGEPRSRDRCGCPGLIAIVQEAVLKKLGTAV